MTMTVTRGTTNGNVRGSTADRRARRAYLMVAYASDVEGFVRCYRCGVLLYNEDDHPERPPDFPVERSRMPLRLTTDRIVPGCKGGTYKRPNIRPACGGCNSETGGRLAGKGKKR